MIQVAIGSKKIKWSNSHRKTKSKSFLRKDKRKKADLNTHSTTNRTQDKKDKNPARNHTNAPIDHAP